MKRILFITTLNFLCLVGFGMAGSIASANELDSQPFCLVQPKYPSSAGSKGVEGYVRLEFTVTKKGKVRNPVILESEPPLTFDRAARKAVRKARCKPGFRDGEAVDVDGVKSTVHFSP